MATHADGLSASRSTGAGHCWWPTTSATSYGDLHGRLTLPRTERARYNETCLFPVMPQPGMTPARMSKRGPTNSDTLPAIAGATAVTIAGVVTFLAYDFGAQSRQMALHI